MPNLHGYDPDESYTGFGNIPAGWYNAAITESKEVENKSGKGCHLALTFTILDGPQKNKKIWDRLNLQNPSEQTVRISRSQLKRICVACGDIRPTDSVELHNIPMAIYIDRDPKNEDFDRITKYQARGAPEATVPPDDAPTNAPWKK